jgi:hypothetical protein
LEWQIGQSKRGAIIFFGEEVALSWEKALHELVNKKNQVVPGKISGFGQYALNAAHSLALLARLL